MQSRGFPTTNRSAARQPQHEYWYDERKDTKLVGFHGAVPTIGSHVKLKDPRVGQRVAFRITRVCWVYPYDGTPKSARVYLKPIKVKPKN